MPTATKKPMAATSETVETWRSTIRGRAGVTRYLVDGSERTDAVGPGAEFVISTDDRRRNQTAVVNKLNDPFTNGIFALVSAPAGTEDAAILKANEASMSDEAIDEILSLRKEQFTERIAGITSAVLLHRIWGMAREIGADNRIVKAAAARLKAVDPNSVLVGDNIVKGAEVAELDAAHGDTKDIRGPRRYEQLEHLGQ